MSHITAVEVEVRDLDAVKALCLEKGWTFHENKKSFVWYGQFVGDSPVPAGMTPEDYGKCDHAIGVPDTRYGYEIGLRANAKGGYNVVFDAWDKGLASTIGAKGGLFMQGYGIAKAEREAKRRGLNVRRQQGKNGVVKLVLTGNGL